MKRAGEAMVAKGREDVEKSRISLDIAIAAGREASRKEMEAQEARSIVPAPELPHKTSVSKTFDDSVKALKVFAGRKCLRCDSTDIKMLPGKADIFSTGLALTFPILMLFGAGKKSKNIHVCKNCGFSWDDR